MVLFLKKIFLFFSGAVLIIVVYLLFLDYINKYEFPKEPNNSVFIWGDSQAYQGIDLKVLKSNTKRGVLTAAKHGAGVYDFIVFAEGVPKRSNVILAVPELVQLRRKEKDRNDSGISLSALALLYKNNYTINELVKIVTKNKRQKGILQQSSKMYNYNDSITYKEPISMFRKAFNDVPPYLSDKQKIFLEGIEILQEKKCRILFVEFPYHSILTNIQKESPIHQKSKDFKQQIMNRFERAEIDTIKLGTEKQTMYDLTHLNEVGAEKVSQYLSVQIKKKDIFQKGNSKNTKFVIIEE